MRLNSLSEPHRGATLPRAVRSYRARAPVDIGHLARGSGWQPKMGVTHAETKVRLRTIIRRSREVRRARIGEPYSRTSYTAVVKEDESDTLQSPQPRTRTAPLA